MAVSDYDISDSDFLDPNKMVANASRIQEHLERGQTLREAMDVSHAVMSEKYAFACSQYIEGDFTTATDVYSYLAILDPYDIRVWLGLGTTLMMQGKVQEGVDCLHLAHTIDPSSSWPFYLLGLSAYLRHDPQLASHYLRDAGARALDPNLEDKILRAETFEGKLIEREVDNACFLSIKALASTPIDSLINSSGGQQALRRKIVQFVAEAKEVSPPELAEFMEGFAEQYGAEVVAFAFHYLRAVQLGTG